MIGQKEEEKLCVVVEWGKKPGECRRKRIWRARDCNSVDSLWTNTVDANNEINESRT